MAETCENCRFWKRGGRSSGSIFRWTDRNTDDQIVAYGYCQRKPKWAHHLEDDWCGEHQPLSQKAAASDVNAETLAVLKRVVGNVYAGATDIELEVMLATGAHAILAARRLIRKTEAGG